MSKGKPGRRCSVCEHPAIESINAALLSGHQQGQVAAEHHLSPDAISRHRLRHLKVPTSDDPMPLPADASAAPVDLMSDMLTMRSRLLKQMGRAERALDTRAVVLIARELSRVSETIGRLSGQIAPDGTRIAIAINNAGPGPASVRERILEKLAALSGEG